MTNAIQIYSYDRLTKEFLGEYKSYESPLEPGVFLDPAFATRGAPPKTKKGFVAIFSGNKWEIAQDKRGETWFDSNGNNIVISEIGDPSELGLLQVAQPKEEINIVPTSVTLAQAKMALYDAGLLDKVESLIDRYQYRPMKIYFDNAIYWERTNPYVMALAIELDLSDNDLDNLFTAASKKVF